MGRYRGALAGVRPDDLAAHAIGAAVERTGIDPAGVCDVYLGAANQAGEDNRDAARMASLLAGLPVEIPGVTVNRLCASGLEAVNQASRALRLGEGDLYLAGGAESMSRAPWVVPKPDAGLATRAADDARHVAGLAPRQPADGRALLDRGDGRDRRERRRALRGHPLRTGQVRASKPRPGDRRGRRGAVRRRDRRRGRAGPRPGRRDRPGRGGRGTACRHLAREARPASAGVPRPGHRDRRQRLDAQRRRRVPGARRRRRGPRRSGPTRWPGSCRSASRASTRPTWESARCRRSGERSMQPG